MPDIASRLSPARSLDDQEDGYVGDGTIPARLMTCLPRRHHLPFVGARLSKSLLVAGWEALLPDPFCEGLPRVGLLTNPRPPRETNTRRYNYIMSVEL